jgi:hypothetical protein
MLEKQEVLQRRRPCLDETGMDDHAMRTDSGWVDR